MFVLFVITGLALATCLLTDWIAWYPSSCGLRCCSVVQLVFSASAARDETLTGSPCRPCRAGGRHTLFFHCTSSVGTPAGCVDGLTQRTTRRDKTERGGAHRCVPTAVKDEPTAIPPPPPPSAPARYLSSAAMSSADVSSHPANL